VVLAAAGNEAIAGAIVSSLAADPDLGRDLVDISVLVELRTQTGFQYFQALLNAPAPTTSTFYGEYPGPVEGHELEKLQARAIDGVAFMMNAASDALLLSTLAATTSNTVRARIVHDYLWIHGPGGRETISAILSTDQQILLDRMEVGGRQPFDTRLAAYLALHPEVIPPSTP
jgi:hypothetical protein